MKKITIIIIVITLFGFLFYWYEYRPTVIRSNCHKEAIKHAQWIYKKKAVSSKKAKEGWYLEVDYEFAYKECLRDNGLER